MTYLIEPSTFGIGYSIFRLEVKDGIRGKVYLADAPTLSEARALCPDSILICEMTEPLSSNTIAYQAA